MSTITKDFLKELSKAKSQTGGTSLITMLISGGYSMSLITKKLVAELSTSTNIKDKTVGKSVASALKSSIALIKTSKLQTAPENGLVLCSGEAQYSNTGKYSL
jgi:peptide subunit release factor 1 (eRF1)